MNDNLIPEDCKHCDGFGQKDGRWCSACNRSGTVIVCASCGSTECDGECEWADVEIEKAG